MADATSGEVAKVRAYSPGRYPILVLELPTGNLRTVYHETGYDLERSKQVTEEWLSDNAIGRHSFIEVSPPEEVPSSGLADYAKERIAQET